MKWGLAEALVDYPECFGHYVITVITPADVRPNPPLCGQSLNSSEGRNSVAGVKSRNNLGEGHLTA